MKKLIKIFTLSLITLLVSCQAEKDAAHKGEKAYTTNKISFEAFKQQTGLTNFETTFKIPSKSTNLEGKTADGKYELNDFDINTNVVNSLEYQQKTTYSLQVHPKNEVSENYFNLILYKKNNVWEKTIIEMKPNADNLYELQNNLTDEFQGQMRQVYNSEVTTTNTMKCKTVTITSSNCQGCEGECDLCSLCVSVTIYNMCDFGGIPYTGGGGGGYSGSGGGGYGGSGGGSGIFVGPIPPSDDVLDPDTIVFDPNLQDPLSVLDSQQAMKFNAFMNALQNTNLAAYNYLNQNPAIKNEIQNYLISNGFSVESKDFANELIDLAKNETNQADVFNLTKISLLFETTTLDIFSDEFAAQLDPYVDLDLTYPPSTLDPSMFVAKTYLNYLKLRGINPEWSRAKCGWEATKDVIHLGLDAFGLIPVGGEIADLVNGVLYTIEGDKLNATLSFASAVPIVGWAGPATKYGLMVVVTATGKTKLVFKVVNGVLKFGNRGQLRKILNITSSAIQAHHIIPWAKSGNNVIQKAARLGVNPFHMNSTLNGIPLSTAVHNGSHSLYDQRVVNRLTDIENQFGPNMTPQQAYDSLTDLINDIKTAIANNPNTPINQLIF
jgi:hypothetical protein